MVRRIHDHYPTEGGRIVECTCPNPAAPMPSWARDRPAPTGYRDEHERFHPGPGADGYREHLEGCLPCWRGFRLALDRGEGWAVSSGIVTRLTAPPAATSTEEQAGPGQALVRIESQFAGRLVVWAIGAAIGVGLVLLLPLAVAAVACIAVLAGGMAAQCIGGADRTPTARILRR